MSLSLKAVLLMATAAAAATIVAPGLAQNQGRGQPGAADARVVAAFEARLRDSGAAFRATVDKAPTAETIAQGRTIARQGAADGAVASCLSCHGENGEGQAPTGFPRLAEMPAWYLFKQLNDYAGGTRPNDIMTPIARQLSAGQREAVSVYYSLSRAAPTPQEGSADQAQLRHGETLSSGGLAERGIPGCANCHASGGVGIVPSVPALAGQHAEYIAAQLRLWKDGTRANDPMHVMKTIADKMTDQDIDAVAAYFSRLAPPDHAPRPGQGRMPDRAGSIR
jgi:cytochrome c553